MKSEDIWEKVRPRLWEYLFRSPGGDLSVIREFTDGATPDTIGGWLVNSRPPIGVRLIMLWHLLHALGLESEELNELDPFNRYLGELLTFAHLRDDRLMEIVEVKNSQTLLQILRGQKPMRQRYTLAELRERYGDEVQRGLDEWILPRRLTADAQATSPPAPAAEQQPQGFDPLVELASKLSAVLPLLSYAASDRVTPEQRSEFRELLGKESMFKVLHYLYALQSEKHLKNRR